MLLPDRRGEPVPVGAKTGRKDPVSEFQSSALGVEQLLRAAAGCLRPLSEATTLPPRMFSDPEWFEAERLKLFHGGWIAVARSDEVAEPNEYVTTSIAGEPVVVIRGRDGVIRALSNVCRHRSMKIIEGVGSVPSLQCPYHQWTYRLDGSLLNAPLMDAADGFDAAAVCLPEFAVTEWQGWVFVNIDANAAPISDAVPTLTALLTEHRVGEMVRTGTLDYPSPWNWKISVENFLESYHHRGVHPTTLDWTYPGSKSFVPDSGDEPWGAVDHVSVVEGQEPFIAIVMYPTLMFAILRGIGMTWFKLSPLTAVTSHLTIEIYMKPEMVEFGEAVLEGTRAINDEDVAINRRTAEGFDSG